MGTLSLPTTTTQAARVPRRAAYLSTSIRSNLVTTKTNTQPLVPPNAVKPDDHHKQDVFIPNYPYLE
jgi:hypothetical protein